VVLQGGGHAPGARRGAQRCPRIRGDPSRAALWQEARSAAKKVALPMLRIYDSAEEEQGLPGLVMELLRGNPWRGASSAVPCPERRSRGQITLALCHAWTAFHKIGIVHRDHEAQKHLCFRTSGTKADGTSGVHASSFEFEGGTWRLLAHATDPGIFLGHTDKHHPEQFRGRPVDSAIGLFSIGRDFVLSC